MRPPALRRPRRPTMRRRHAASAASRRPGRRDGRRREVAAHAGVVQGLSRAAGEDQPIGLPATRSSRCRLSSASRPRGRGTSRTWWFLVGPKLNFPSTSVRLSATTSRQRRRSTCRRRRARPRRCAVRRTPEAPPRGRSRDWAVSVGRRCGPGRVDRRRCEVRDELFDVGDGEDGGLGLRQTRKSVVAATRVRRQQPLAHSRVHRKRRDASSRPSSGARRPSARQ